MDTKRKTDCPAALHRCQASPCHATTRTPTRCGEPRKGHQPAGVVQLQRLTGSVAYELRRLCAPELIVIDADPLPQDLPCVARLAPWSHSARDAMPTARRSAILLAVEVEGGERPTTMDLSLAADRLKLLATLARAVARKRLDAAPPAWIFEPLHIQVAYVVLSLTTQLTETALAHRVGISACTVRRWFDRDHGLSPRDYLKMLRAIAIGRLLAGGMSTGGVADALGYEHTESMLRTLRCSGGNVAMLKASGG